MLWKEYQYRFIKKAYKEGYSQSEIEICLNYAKNLFDKKFPIIYSQHHLSLLVGYSEDYLYKVSNSSKKFYRVYEIPKKNGGTRTIAEPLPSLKEIQYWILENILYKCEVSKYAKAYVRGQSIKKNAKFHINQKVLLSLDIRDFFGSIKFFDIYKIFSSMGYSNL